MRKSTLIISGLLFSSAIHAAGTESFDVDFVGCLPNGTCYIGIAPESSSTSCASKSQIRFDISLPGSKAQYSAALTAFAANKKIKVAVTDKCLDTYPQPDWLHVDS